MSFFSKLLRPIVKFLSGGGTPQIVQPPPPPPPQPQLPTGVVREDEEVASTQLRRRASRARFRFVAGRDSAAAPSGSGVTLQ
jgi:hypothetical protein